MFSFLNWRSEKPVELERSTDLKFFIHDVEHTVKSSQVTSETTLNQYLREMSHLTGTKYMCLEGGCGSCVVAVTVRDPLTRKDVMFAVNSCLTPIYLCYGWKIHTVEGIGHESLGYHPIQKALAKFNGSQCGFCTSGMIMNMYVLYEQGNLLMEEVEDSFGGNICRCTGYRPILSAFKSLCKDAPPELKATPDIEDVYVCPKADGCKTACIELCEWRNRAFYYEMGSSRWIKVYRINEIQLIFKTYEKFTYMFVGGNTATGVYKRRINPQIYIDINSVSELKSNELKSNVLKLGANMSLTAVLKLFYETAEKEMNFRHLKKMAEHIDLVANVPVRNVGTLAGNLSIKHTHNEFPSDIFLILETAMAKLNIVDSSGQSIQMTVAEYLKYNMDKKLITSIELPALDDNYEYESYKIMMRAQNTHALVNAGFLIKLKEDHETVESTRIIYGGINPKFVHAIETEKYLQGKKLFENSTLQGAFKELDKELKPDYVLPDHTPEFRKGLSICLFYKFVLSIAPKNKLSRRNESGGHKLTRPVSTGSQEYGTNKTIYPVTQPISKLEMYAQCSGQAEYINDIPDRPNQLFAAFVLSQAKPYSVITHTDASEALKVNGVVAYFDKTDIPGLNSFTPKELSFEIDEEIFCDGTIRYYHQPVGMIVAKSQEAAEKASELVKFTYASSTTRPLFTIREVLKDPSAKRRVKKEVEHPRTNTGKNVQHVVKGSLDISWQYHYHMETQCCNVVPTEDGFDVFASTQSMDYCQTAISTCLGIPANKINVVVRRLGGAYGGKISRNSLVSCAAAIAAYKLRKPVKFWMPFETNMKVIGKRFPFSGDYEVGVDQSGIIQYLDLDFYSDIGVGGNEKISSLLIATILNPYKNETFKVSGYIVSTDTPASTWCRSPATTEGVVMIESIMDHIASSANLNPTDVRLQNLKRTEHGLLIKLIDDFKKWADVDARIKTVEDFNQENRWRKRGLSIVTMAYPFELYGNWTVLISIYHSDGTVALAHGGVEMGQGINTKAAQVCAYCLGIPVEYISVKPSNNLVSPNSSPTGGSLTSEAVCYAVIQACKVLNDRIKPVRDKMNNPTWPDLINKCFESFIDLTATYMVSRNSPNLHEYNIYAVCATEVEVDILTGNHNIVRVDLLEDTGDSLNPEIDIGQVEGAFVMGLGYYTTEEIQINSDGKILTTRTWNYRAPGAKDIPIDFRVKFPEHIPNPLGVLKSKATAEPPFTISCSVPLALRQAVASARRDANPKAEKWYPFEGTSTVENTFLNSLNDYSQFNL